MRSEPVIEIGLSEMPESGRMVPAPLRLDPLDELERLGLALLELDAGVEVLGVLSDDDDVDVVVARAGAGDRERRTQVHVEVELLAQRHVHAAEAGADRRGDRALDGDLVLADRLDDVVGQRRAVLVHDVLAGVGDLPLDVDAGRLDDAAHRRGDLGTDAVAGDERDGVLGHAWCLLDVGTGHSARLGGWKRPRDG